MDGFDPRASFGPAVAERYDDELRGDEQAAAAFLAGYARSGTALELAIGTGRIALPLAQRGVRVDGIELSPAPSTSSGARRRRSPSTSTGTTP